MSGQPGPWLTDRLAPYRNNLSESTAFTALLQSTSPCSFPLPRATPMSTHGSDCATLRLAFLRRIFSASTEFTVLLQSTSPNGGTFVGSTIETTAALTALMNLSASTEVELCVSETGG